MPLFGEKSKGLIEVISLDTGDRRVVVDQEFLQYPRSVTIDVTQTLIYFTDWGKRPAVYRSDYYGNHIEVISDLLPDMPIKNPNGIFFRNAGDGHTHMYLVDSQYDSGKLLKKYFCGFK